MEYVKEKGFLVVSPYKLRPGSETIVRAEVVYKFETEWDSDTTLSVEMPGYVTPISIISSRDLDYGQIDIEYGEESSTVVLSPMGMGVIDIEIFSSKRDSTGTIVSESAISAGMSNEDIDERWMYSEMVNDILVPHTIIDTDGAFEVPENEDIEIHEIKSFELDFETHVTGRCSIDDEIVYINSQGYLSIGKYALRRGIEYVKFPMSYEGAYEKVVGGRKLVKIDNQATPAPIEFRGMEYVRDVVFIMTSDGLYGVDRWGDFTRPHEVNGVEFFWPEIRGYDLTYLADDSLAVSDVFEIKKYYMRHDFVYMDKDNNRIFFREPNPDFEVVEGVL